MYGICPLCNKPLTYLGSEATCTYCVSTGNREAFEAAMKARREYYKSAPITRINLGR